MQREGHASDPKVDAKLSARWEEAARRLGLSSQAQTLGRSILAATFSDRGEHGLDRAGVMELGAAELEPLDSLRALGELEARGVVRACADDSIPWLATPLRVAARVREHVLGLEPGSRTGRAIELAPRVTDRLDELTLERPVLVVIAGRPGSGRDALLDALLFRTRRSALVRTPSELVRGDDPLEPEVSGRIAVWDAREADPSPDDRARAASWLARSLPLAVAMVRPDQDVPRVGSHGVFVLATDPPTGAERRWCWSHALRAAGCEADAAEALADELRVGPGYAHRVAAMLAQRHAGVTVAAARRGLAALLPPSAIRGVQVEHPDISMDALILDVSVARGLGHMLELVRHHDALGGSRVGVKALLSGPPGTGKTMAARALASELGRPLHRVDLAAVVSKWIGETEKNLAQAFEAAEAVGAVLLFDEGEALLGERGQVARGSDRYANLEVAYLLHALEAHDGVVVVTTNARDKIDRAFVRRFDVVLELGKPDMARRIRLWQQELGEAGAKMPREFFNEVARHSELTGGHIASAARLARALARAQHREAVEPEDVLEALAFEHEKLGGAMAATRLRERATNGAARWRR